MTESGNENGWLRRMVGEWTYEMRADGPDGEPFTDTGTETVRSLGGIWVQCEGRSKAPDGTEAISIMTLGLDPATARVKGTFVSSMMTHLWIYDGELDAAANVLTLATEGPGYPDESKWAAYRDIIEIHDDDHRVQTSRVRREDGTWHEFVVTHYRRVK